MTQKIIYSQILSELYAGSEWSLSNENYDELVWLSNSPKPSKNELDEKWQEAQNATQEKINKAAADKAIAEAKLAALGLTADDLKALGLA